VKNYFIKIGYKINEINLTNDEVNNTNYWNRKRNIAAEVYQYPVYKFLSEYIQKNNSSEVIDIGCGVGRKLEYVHGRNPNVKIIGIDQEDPIDYCRTAYSFGEWFTDDFEKPCTSKDIRSKLIVCSDVIEHLINPDLLLDYIKSKLAINGTVILSTPERDSLRGVNCNYSPNIHHIREWSFEEFERYLESKGFEIVEHFLQYPIKFKLNMIFFHEIIKRALMCKPLKYNQVVVARVK